ncbi:flagellar hook-basal body complex protein [Rhodobacter sp. KR11]|jgi:flagellar hook protein FlgE|uniref:flagellar hook protein FlgE n=1 Tax=Rhodobacter sp. KR11 TaxID=2974588 RepID=UPI002221F575|nr:flagellar hook-basal body complex protein [Rhodobacter sp. KR11]MCW1918342.1 flagellar hook-basal body complex protein [Rhodobacter sp. KR11]
MTITSSLNAGVAGLNANANRLSTISDNIANSSTYGYKKATADFYSVVVQGDLSTAYSAGGVRSTSYRLIDEHGPLIGTTNSTDFAIDGRGFMAVTTIDAVNRGADLPISLTTTGSFKPDAEGVLRTSTGKVLMGWVANPDGSLGNYPRDTMSALQPVRLDTNQYISNPTTELSLSANLPATSTASGADGDPWEMTVQYAGNLGTSETLHYTFTPTVPATGRSNEWTMTIRDSASDDAVIAEYTVAFDSSQASGGTLASVTTVSGADYDPATGIIPLTVGGGNINMNIGAVGVTGGMTQLSQDFAPIGKAINGTPVARLVSVNIDDNGYLTANYDQGFSKVIYQIPVVDVPNPNGLISHSDQTYEISAESGAFYLWDSGDGPTGKMVGYSQEQSTTDVTTELTNLITTQRAYSSNVKVIQTVDEMLQETANLKR